MNFHPDKLKAVITRLKEDLGSGLVVTDIWNTVEGKSIIFLEDHIKPSKTISLLDEVTRKLDQTLKAAYYPGLGSYYFINLTNNLLLVVLSIDIYQQYILVDLSKTTMGVLMSAAMPNLLENLAEAEAEAEAAAGKTVNKEDTGKPGQRQKRSVLREILDGFTQSIYYRNRER